MKNVKKKIALVVVMLLMCLAPVNILHAKETTDENINFDGITIIETLPNGWTKYEYTDSENILARVQGKGYSKVVGYFDSNKMLVCEFKVTVGFNYGYSDGIVQITSFTYSQTYVHSGYSLVFTNSSRTNGSPAVATVYYTIYNNSNLYLNDKTSLYCYNNGNVVIN